MDYQQALDYIYSFIDYERVPRPRDAASYDLRRMQELLGRLDSRFTLPVARGRGAWLL